MKLKLTYLLLILLTITSCRSKYQKLLRSNDYNAKYEAAVQYYNNEEYVKAYHLFESIQPIYKGTDKDESIAYYVAQCYFKDDDFMMAAFYFKEFIKTFPSSDKAEECRYKTGFSYYKCSPKYTLDQDFTRKSIEELQMYLNKYPAGTYAKESNDNIEEMRKKLEKKAYAMAKQYDDLQEYKAAAIAFKHFINDFPDSDSREEALYMIVKSDFDLARNSVEQKQFERYEMVISDYYSYIDEYPSGKYLAEVEKYYSKSQDYILKIAR